MNIEELIKDRDFYKYAEDVVNDKIKSGVLIKLACKRFLNDCKREDLYFDLKKVDKFFKFCELFRHYKSNDCNSLGKKFELATWQKWVMANLIGFYQKKNGRRRFNTALLCIARKNGKALDINTPIPTPNGWKTMGDIKEGDFVWGADGKPTKVVYTTDIMYNHNCYKITFEDGEEIIADADHNWEVKRNSKKTVKTHIETTEEIFKSIYYRVRNDGKGIEYLVRIPMNKPTISDNIKLPLDPYTLGCWLADGTNDKPNFTIGKNDVGLYDRISKIYGSPKIYIDRRNPNVITLKYTGDKGKNNSLLRHSLIECDLLGNKHIPEIYLRAGTQQRIELLQGFMDSDGYISESGQCEFVQKNIEITNGICEILSSLGIKYKRITKIPTINGKECDAVQRVQFYCDKSNSCFTIQRKYERLKDSLNKRMLYKSIKKIESVESVPVKCISVDNEDHLYCCGKKYTVTHNTALAAVISLWFLFDEAGASVGLAANSREQASLAFDDVTKFASQIDPKEKTIKRYRNYLKSDFNSGRLKVFASDSSSMDGENLGFILIDEYHSASDNKVYAVLESSQVSRPNPLLLVISTVGYNLNGPMKTMYDVDVEILNGIKTDDNRFIAIYQMDEGDDWEDENNWIKANPNLGESLTYESLRKEKVKAKNSSSKLNEILTKNFNVWCNSSEVWIPDSYLLKTFKKIDVNKFKDCECYCGIDLASTGDMTAVSFMFLDENNNKYFKNYYYLPEIALVESSNRELYKYWKRQGYLTITPGNVTDYNYIINDIMKMYNIVNLRNIFYDNWNSTQAIIQMSELGLNCTPYSQSIGNFNKPTREMERLIRQNNVTIDNNEITLWMFRNVDLKNDWNNNIKPVKTSKEKKIDGIVAMLMSLGGYLDTPHYSGGIFVM